MVKYPVEAPNAKTHRFGGDWTAAKLDVLAKYLKAYTTALQDQPFKKAYIDAFAGTGYREPRQSGEDGVTLFPDLAAEAPQRLLDGSARMALQTEPGFDRYIYIERNAKRCSALEDLRTEYPDRAASIEIRNGEANQEIQRLCAKNWAGRRAVLFLDPYGMQVDWATVQAVAATRAIDLWLLFPLGIGVNRLATRSGQIPPSWAARLTALLGTDAWYDAFYRSESAPNLFDTEAERVVKASQEVIGQYFVDRLKDVFPAVADKPLVLRNSARCPLYLFCFAAGNERGGKVALRIANHLLRQ